MDVLAGLSIDLEGVPLALIAVRFLLPSVADRALRHGRGIARLIPYDRLPLAIARLGVGFKIARAQRAPCHIGIFARALIEADQHGKVGELPYVISEVRIGVVQVEFLEDNEVHRESQSSIGALLGMQPPVCVFRALAVIGTDIDELRAVIARLDHEVRIGRSCHGDVHAPAEDVVGVVPCFRLGHVRLLSEGLR